MTWKQTLSPQRPGRQSSPGPPLTAGRGEGGGWMHSIAMGTPPPAELFVRTQTPGALRAERLGGGRLGPCIFTSSLGAPEAAA